MTQQLIPGVAHRVAALFVQADGVYSAMPDVDAWPEERDARTYAGPLPVRTWGGVIEHPAGSEAWPAHGLPGPMERADAHGGWTLPVFQAWWGHEAIKPTWLYIVGAPRACIYPAPLAAGTRPLEHMSKRQRAATPLPFARWLVELAASAQRRQGVA